MLLQGPIQSLLLQLQDVLERLDDVQYTTRIDILSGATPGQHVRHMLEFMQELQKGYESGLVNYDRRSRSLELETNRRAAVGVLVTLVSMVDRPEKDLMLAAQMEGDDAIVIRSNYSRELLYNIEHIVHHMALLRVGISVISALIRLPDGFGVAASTLKYRQRCAS